MTKNLSVTEKMAYSTVRIECETTTGELATGTGFFYGFAGSDDVHIPVIVTNKHVIADAARGKFHLTIADIEGNPIDGQHFACVFDNFESRWIPHPDKNVDLCVMPFAPLLRKTEKDNKTFFFQALDKSLIPKQQELDQLTQMEEVVMIGYPNGIWDQINNMPIFRKGITATHPRLPWNGKQEFLIDAACFPGSSGSPVFLLNLGSYPARDGGVVIGSRIKLLGILYAGPQHTVTGEIEVVAVPTHQRPISISQIPNNLGIVIRARRLNEFESIFEEILRNEPKPNKPSQPTQ